MFNFENVYGLECFEKTLNKLMHIGLFTNKECQDYLEELKTINLSEYEGGVKSTIKLSSGFTGITLTELGLGLFSVTARDINYIMGYKDFDIDNIASSLTERYNISDKLDKELLLSTIPVVFKDCKVAESLLEKISELKEVSLKENTTFLTVSLGWDVDCKFSNERNKIIITFNNNNILEYHQYMTKEMLYALAPEEVQVQENTDISKEEREMVDTQNVKLKDVVKSLDILTNLKNIINPINMLDPKEKVSITLSDTEYQLEIIPEEQNSGMFKINVFGNSSLQLQTWDSHSFCSGLAHQIPLISILFNTKHNDIDKLQEFITNSLSMLK